MLKKITAYLLYTFLFLLPWQTRWIYQPAQLNGGFWEYGSLSLYGTEILMWLIILLFCIDNLIRKDFWKKVTEQERKARIKHLVVGAVVLVFFSFLIWHSINWEISYQYVLRMLGAFCLFVIISHSVVIPAKAKIQGGNVDSCFHGNEILLFALWLGGLFQGLLAIFQFFTQQITANKWLGLAEHSAADLGASVIQFGDERWLRAYGSFGWPNALGIYLAVILMLGLWLYFQVSFAKRIMIMMGQLVILSGFILSFSRGAWLAAFVGIVFMTIAVYKRKQCLMIDFCKQLFIFFVIFLLFFVFLKPLFLTRLSSTERLEQKSSLERKTQIKEWQEIFSKNWLLGVGPGAYTRTLYGENGSKPAWQYQPVHNIYLLILAEQGLIVFIFYSFILYIIFFNKRMSDTIISPVLVVIVAGLFDHWLFSMYTGLVFSFVILALYFSSNLNIRAD